MSYEVVVPARNEEKYLDRTLRAIRAQNISPRKLIVVNDGSKDMTSEIAERYADEVVDLPDRGYNAICFPSVLAKTFNQGLKRVSSEAKYVLICSADNILPSHYTETILRVMDSDPKLVIASGRGIRDPPRSDLPPRGTRIVDTNYWRQLNGMVYPETLEWESWLVYKTLQLGYKVRQIPDLITIPQRLPFSTKLKPLKSFSLGVGMNFLGYFWLYALLRASRFGFHKPKSGIFMLAGYIAGRKSRSDVADWVTQNQKRNLCKLILAHLLRGR